MSEEPDHRIAGCGAPRAWTRLDAKRPEIVGLICEYTQLLPASDSTYMTGYMGIEGVGNVARRTGFRRVNFGEFPNRKDRQGRHRAHPSTQQHRHGCRQQCASSGRVG